MGGILVGVLAAVRCAHQIQDLIIVVLPVCPVQAQSTLDFFTITSENLRIGMTGLTSGVNGQRQNPCWRQFVCDSGARSVHAWPSSCK